MKLLNKSIGLYIIYATVLLMIVVPVLYFAIQSRVTEEVDESLTAQKETIITRLEKSGGAGIFPLSEITEPDVTINPTTIVIRKADSFYSAIIFDKIANEKSPYRILESNITLKGKPYSIKIKNSLIDSEDLIESIVKIVGVLLLLIIIGLVLINQLLSKKIWKPFYQTIDKLNAFKIEKNKTLHFEKTSISEFTDLNNAITLLTIRNSEAYQSQKEFTENASHEMQTPLAVLQGKLDLLMQTSPLTNEQSELIGGIADVNQRINRLNKSLLLLAKIENSLFVDTENITVKNVIEKLSEQYKFQAQQKSIVIENEMTDDFAITANRMLLEIMLGNFLSNAVRHNNGSGVIKISVHHKEIKFSNTGSSPLDTDKIFLRFHKQTTDSNSTGLGLQIAKKIAEYYHWDIQYEFQKTQHMFSIKF